MPYACPPHLRHLHHLRRVWLVLSLVLLASPAQATSVVAKPFSAVVQESETIAVGTVTAIAAEWDAAHNRPFTLVTFSTLDVLKGAHTEPELTLRVLGGPHPDGSILQVAGVPQFSLGDRAGRFCDGQRPLCGAARRPVARRVPGGV